MKYNKYGPYDNITTVPFKSNYSRRFDFILFFISGRIKLAEKLKQRAFFSLSVDVIPPPPPHKTHCGAFICLSTDVRQAPTVLPLGKNSYVSSSPNSIQLQMKTYTLWRREVLLWLLIKKSICLHSPYVRRRNIVHFYPHMDS